MHKSSISPSLNHTPSKRAGEDFELLVSPKKKQSQNIHNHFLSHNRDSQRLDHINSKLLELKQLHAPSYKLYDRDTITDSNDSTNEYRARDELTSETQHSHNGLLNQDKEEMKQLKSENHHLETELQKTRHENQVLTEQLEKTASHSNKLEIEIRKLRQSTTNTEQNKTIMEQYHRLEKDHHECQVALDSKTKELDHCLDRIEELNKELSLLQQGDVQNQNNNAQQEAIEKIESLAQLVNEKDQIIQQHERNINNYRAQIQSLEQQQRRLSLASRTTSNDEELYLRLNTSKLSISKELYDTATALNTLASDVAKKEDEIRKLESQRTDTRSRLTDALDYNKSLEQKVQELEDLVRQQVTTHADYAKLQEAYTQANKHIQDLQFELKDKDDQHYQEHQMTENKIQKLESRNQTLKEKAIHAETRLTDTHEEYSKLEQIKLDLEQYQEQLKREMKRREMEMRELRTQMQAKQHEAAQVQAELEYVQGQLEEQLKLTRNLEQQVSRMNNAENQIQERSERITHLEATVSSIRKDLNDAIRVKVETEERYKSLESDLDDLTRHFQDKQNSVGMLERENQRLERKNAEFERKILFVQELLRKAMEDKEKKM